jgi:transposase
MDISLEARTKICTLHEHTSKSQREIARIVGVSQRAISNIIKLGKEADTLHPECKARCGRKAKSSPEVARMIIEESVNDPRKTSNDLRKFIETMGISLSSRTVRRCLVDGGRLARRPSKKQLLTSAMREKRLEWAEKYQSWTKYDWRMVLFSDESHFMVQGQHSQYVRRSKGEPINQAHMNQYVKHPQKRMFWGSFCYKGVGSLRPIMGIMNADRYIDVVNNNIQKDMKEAFTGGNGIFQQDLAPCHRAKKVRKLFREKNIRLLDWPGNSPDLNPIENLWSIVKAELLKRDCTTEAKLTRSVIDIWFSDPKINKCCLKLVDSMPERIMQVILNRGGHTKY